MTYRVDPSIPEAIATDYLEALRCFNVAAYRACVTMARRCLHCIAKEQGYDEGGDLYKPLNRMQADGLLPKALAAAGQHIRVFGKHGAHPLDDGIGPIEMQDARDALDFCDMIMEQLYVLTARIQASRAGAEYPRPAKT